nr:MAG TPA: hypothetical protein [Caudoviricetes sp.]
MSKISLIYCLIDTDISYWIEIVPVKSPFGRVCEEPL